MPEDYLQLSLDYQRIEKAITYLEQNFRKQPNLSDIAKSVYLSEYHFQRLFSRWVGISPKRFLQYITKENAKALLEKSNSLFEVTCETGLSSPGRLHDLFVKCEAVTPGEFKKQGENLSIEYGIHPTPFGECLLATTARGICGLVFIRENGCKHEISALKKRWRNAQFEENHTKTKQLIRQIFAPFNGKKTIPLHLYLQGTNFQIKVWEALLKIPFGYIVAYEDIAKQIGNPGAVRAVANAVAYNPVPFLVPCHRVIRKIGEFGGYQGGTARKKAILAWEGCRA